MGLSQKQRNSSFMAECLVIQIQAMQLSSPTSLLQVHRLKRRRSALGLLCLTFAQPILNTMYSRSSSSAKP